MLFSTRLACITHRIGVCSSLSWASAPQRVILARSANSILTVASGAATVAIAFPAIGFVGR
jgi:hypothetical protein